MGILSEDFVVTIFSVEGESSALVSRLVPMSPLHCSSMGKLFLSAMDEENAKTYFAAHQVKRTFNTITNYSDFLIEKEKILKSYISYDIEEYEYGLGCVAAPIFDMENRIVAAVSVSGPISRLKFKGVQNIVDELKKATSKISDSLKISGIVK